MLVIWTFVLTVKPLVRLIQFAQVGLGVGVGVPVFVGVGVPVGFGVLVGPTELPPSD